MKRALHETWFMKREMNLKLLGTQTWTCSVCQVKVWHTDPNTSTTYKSLSSWKTCGLEFLPYVNYKHIFLYIINCEQKFASFTCWDCCCCIMFICCPFPKSSGDWAPCPKSMGVEWLELDVPEHFKTIKIFFEKIQKIKYTSRFLK